MHVVVPRSATRETSRMRLAERLLYVTRKIVAGVESQQMPETFWVDLLAIRLMKFQAIGVSGVVIISMDHLIYLLEGSPHHVDAVLDSVVCSRWESNPIFLQRTPIDRRHFESGCLTSIEASEYLERLLDEGAFHTDSEALLAEVARLAGNRPLSQPHAHSSTLH